MKKKKNELIDAGFEILYENEYFPKIKFLDLGAIAYFAKIIKWEFMNFSVINSIDKFEILEKELHEKGYVQSTEHRFIIVARKR